MNNQCPASEAAGEKAGFEKLKPRFGHVKHVVAVMSGKGGVGKSTASALLAVSLARLGLKVGILDADITGPSIPKMFGLRAGVSASEEEGIQPAASKSGIKVMSLNLLLPEEELPVIWRGPIIAGTVKQFWEDVAWGELDYMIVDLPPGTGDVPLTVMQLIPLDGMVVVSSPQDLALMVVSKAINMADALRIPIWGLIENMSHVVCPSCSEVIRLFGPSRVEEVARKTGVKLTAVLPIDPRLSDLCDHGKIEEYQYESISRFVEDLSRLRRSDQFYERNSQ